MGWGGREGRDQDWTFSTLHKHRVPALSVLVDTGAPGDGRLEDGDLSLERCT